MEDQTYIPLLDVQGNIRRLVNLDTGITSTYDFTAFGETLRTSGDQNPWRSAAKRFDPELGLIYFGKRYYDPKLGRWLTTDPAGFIDSANLYQYVLNNPFKYRDPHGESVLGFLVGIGEVIVGGAICLTGGALEVATCGGYTFALGFHEAAGIALMTHGAAHASYHSRDLGFGRRSSYSTRVENRHTPDQEAISDLGKQSGRKGVSNSDADTLLDWAKEYDFPHRDDRGQGHWKAKDGADHIHIGQNNPIPITP